MALSAHQTELLADAGELAARIADGSSVAMPPDYSMPAMAVVRALIRRGARGLRLIGVPVLGFPADLLIGAGCVAGVESSAVSLGEAGLAPRFTEAVERGELKVLDATCPAVHGALQAAEKGVPFMPLRGLAGSDLLAMRPDWRPVKEGGETIVLIPALSPDVALFHARWVDDAGNAWIGRRRELATMAHAAREAIVTFEERRPGDMLEDELLAPGCVSGVYIGAAAPSPRGAWPLGIAGVHPIDDAHLMLYARRARTREGFESYLREFVLA